ncbi:helix-turn-helix domain-containing protein [Streptomyces kanamyceticus]|uniref:Putative DNA-binding protein n=1 Tax=Streptomyces kanamyceticus TaxID=1967 RepID=Q1EQU6_STRKN|nr:helix-turn-helix transcriptional regulator [Streptomyces kanamyceticus]QEU90478.1 XRE family transcriptional regulator [Streptomyces kanamyceticus]BAE95424.1 putative DNA-binding protein [Streptomyces kanamyceticus]
MTTAASIKGNARGSTQGNAAGVGPLLRAWRERRRVSQLELALRADSSARHISFVETGRSRPSEEFLLRLADHLDVPMRDRNSLLLAAGYAPRFRETPLDDPSMGALRESLDRLLTGYEPYPALVVDATYDVIAANHSLATLLGGLPEHLLASQPLNAMRLTLHPEGLAPRIRNLREWRGHLLHQMERQIALQRSDALRAVYDEVAAYPVADPGVDAFDADTDVPYFALPLRVEHEGQILSFISSISTFNTPMDVTVAELAIETLLPADPATSKYLQSMMS